MIFLIVTSAYYWIHYFYQLFSAILTYRKSFAIVHGISPYSLDFLSRELKRAKAQGTPGQPVMKPSHPFNDSTRPQNWTLADAEETFDEILGETDGKTLNLTSSLRPLI